MMNVIIVSKFFRSPQKLAFDNPKIASAALGIVLAVLALAFGAGFAARGVNGAALGEIAELKAQLGKQNAELASAREEAQREINAVAARVGELQAQANRLNALGERLTRDGKLNDGEFNFDHTPGMGGAETVSDVPAADLLGDLDALQARFDQSGRQLSVLEAMRTSGSIWPTFFRMRLMMTWGRMPAATRFRMPWRAASKQPSTPRTHSWVCASAPSRLTEMW